MVEKKFNFYTIFNSYFKNINKSVFSFLYVYDYIKDCRPDLDPGYSERMLINYFGVYYIISFNFIFYWDLNIINNINLFKKKTLKSRFNLRKLFLLDVKTYTNNNIYLLTLIK
jgi:hypothetical protein